MVTCIECGCWYPGFRKELCRALIEAKRRKDNDWLRTGLCGYSSYGDDYICDGDRSMGDEVNDGLDTFT